MHATAQGFKRSGRLVDAAGSLSHFCLMSLAATFRPSRLADAEVQLLQRWIEPGLADHWLKRLSVSLTWSRESLVLFGKSVPVPRQVAWYGDAGACYRYSRVDHQPLPWTPLLEEIRDRVGVMASCHFNGVLCNQYRDGSDHMGWHSDDETELGPEPVLASLSLGASRRMRFRHRRRSHPTVSLDLRGGDLLIMSGATQHNWQHCLTATSTLVSERINLTFRKIQMA